MSVWRAELKKLKLSNLEGVWNVQTVENVVLAVTVIIAQQLNLNNVAKEWLRNDRKNDS